MTYKLINKPEEKYRKQIIEFIAKNSKSNHPLTNKTLFNWFYLIKENKTNLSTANNNKLSLTMAVNNDEIVSILGFYNVQFRIENKIKNGIHLSFWLSNINHRKGIGALLMKLLVDNNKVIAALGASEMNKPICRALNFRIIEKIKSYIFILRTGDYSKIILDEKSTREFQKFEQPKFYSNLEKTFSHSVKKEQIKSLEIKETGRENIIETHKSQNYLDWRYNNHPFFNYHWSGVKIKSKLWAWFVWRKVNLEGINLCRIVDFDIVDYSKLSLEILDNLIEEIIFSCDKLNCHYIDCFTTNDLLMERLFKNGFADNENYNFPNLIDPVESNVSLNGEYYIEEINEKNKPKIFLYRGDGDQDRINESIWN